MNKQQRIEGETEREMIAYLERLDYLATLLIFAELDLELPDTQDYLRELIERGDPDLLRHQLWLAPGSDYAYWHAKVCRGASLKPVLLHGLSVSSQLARRVTNPQGLAGA